MSNSVFCDKIRKNIINMSPAEIAHRVVKVNDLFYGWDRGCIRVGETHLTLSTG